MLWLAIILVFMPPSDAFFHGAVVSTIRLVHRHQFVFSRHMSSSLATACKTSSSLHTSKVEALGNNRALLLLSPGRLRLRDNAALTRASELGSCGLSICLVWPFKSMELQSPIEAFGYEVIRNLSEELEKQDQQLWLLPSYDEFLQAVQDLKPSHLILDTCLLDRRRKLALKVHNKLNETDMIIEEILDDGTLVAFDDVAKVLGRSRQGGRILRWSTFLNNTMKVDLGIEQHLQPIPTLPPQLSSDMNKIITSVTIPNTDSYPDWAREMLEIWGDVSEEEAMLRAKNAAASTFSSSLTEIGSKSTKLSPFLRWGVISPQRAAHFGVRMRDLLWRDWSYVSYGLLGPLQRGDAVMEFMDNSCTNVHIRNISETTLFNLWCVGNTGSILVDAGMRQLWKEGWMPRRIRLLAAACLVEGLGLDWRLGRDWFEYTLIDHDQTINEAMWQNAGLCGVDPFYFGIPWEQSPNGQEEVDYVEKWINEPLTWPKNLRPYSSMEAPPQIRESAKERRNSLRERGVYKAARKVSNAGVRVAWEGLQTNTPVKVGEVIGSGLTPVKDLKI